VVQWEQLVILQLVVFLLEMGTPIAWCDGLCLVGPIEYPSAADVVGPLLWAHRNAFT